MSRKVDGNASILATQGIYAQESERHEIDIFFDMSRKMYATAAHQSSALYKIADDLTKGFSNITPGVLITDSRIIKIMRYSIVPSLSQMKLGQLIGMASVDKLEEAAISSGPRFGLLKAKATLLSELFNKYLDRQRFLWLNTSLGQEELSLAQEYAQRWTCSLIADQNSATDFRNWRKELQEVAVTDCVVRAGYTKTATRKIVQDPADILPGQFSRECRVKGRSVQKADFAIRLKNSESLLLLEAKAVGVRIDAFKRIKECREKANDWRSKFGSRVVCGAVIAGFIPLSQVKSLIDSKIEVFWEHHLDQLSDFLAKP